MSWLVSRLMAIGVTAVVLVVAVVLYLAILYLPAWTAIPVALGLMLLVFHRDLP